MRRVIGFATAWMAICGSGVTFPSAARADDLVTYEVVSNDIGMANIEYEDSAGRILQEQVPLPWRLDTTVREVKGTPPTGSQVRADWRPSARPSKWVTVRISYQGKVLCQNTLDVGNATCYGITPHFS